MIKAKQIDGLPKTYSLSAQTSATVGTKTQIAAATPNRISLSIQNRSLTATLFVWAGDPGAEVLVVSSGLLPAAIDMPGDAIEILGSKARISVSANGSSAPFVAWEVR